MDPKHLLGREAEACAEKHYRRQGFELLARNYRTKGGELDLVLQRDSLLLFVEVKGRSRDWEKHAWARDWRMKNRRLGAAIRHFLRAHGDLDYEEMRLEVAFVTAGRVEAVFLGI